MRKILVGTDGSRAANRAIVAAAQLAQVTGAELCILTVGGNLSSQELKKLGRIEGDIGEALELLSNQVLNQAKKRATQVGAAKIKLRAGSGEPAQVIIEIAQRMPISWSLAGADAVVSLDCYSAASRRKLRVSLPAWS